MLGNYLQQTTSADDIFRCIFFLGALRVKIVYNCFTIESQPSCGSKYFCDIMQELSVDKSAMDHRKKLPYSKNAQTERFLSYECYIKF